MKASCQTHQLPESIWSALLQQPEHLLIFEQGAFHVEVRLTPIPESLYAGIAPAEQTPSIETPGAALSAFSSHHQSMSSAPMPEVYGTSGHGSETVLCAVGDYASPLSTFDIRSLSSPTTPPPPSQHRPAHLVATATPNIHAVQPSHPVHPVHPSHAVHPVHPPRTPAPPSMKSLAIPTPITDVPPSLLTPLPGSVSTDWSGDRFVPTLAQTSTKLGVGMLTDTGAHALSIGSTSKRASDLSTHAGIQRVPNKMQTSEWKKLIGESTTPPPVHQESPAGLPEDATMLQLQPVLPPHTKEATAPKGSSATKSSMQAYDLFQDLADVEIQAPTSTSSAPSPLKSAPVTVSNTAKQTPPPSSSPRTTQSAQASTKVPPSTFAARPTTTAPSSHATDWSVELDLPRSSSTQTPQTHNEWKKHASTVFRLLRADDTVPGLRKLFARLSAPLITLDTLFKDLPAHHPMPSQFAEASGVLKVLQQPVPFCYKGEANPVFRVVGVCQDQTMVILFQQPDSKNLVFVPLDMDGSMPQIALIEGNPLLLETELTELFQLGARTASPEEAKAKAQQVQQHLSTADHRSVRSKTAAKPSASFNPPSTNHQVNGLDKSIEVDQRLLNRFEFHRIHNREMWDEELQPGVAVFRQNAATLYLDNCAAIEGVLLCLVKQQQYMVFDRRTKRSIHLQPGTQQRLWLRKDDTITQR